jgi:acyl transferase domain-containing protein
MADGDGWVFTGRASVEADAWLSHHAVMGTVLFPGTGFLDLVLHAGGEVGCGVVRELVLEAPLVLPERGGVQLQVVVGEPGDSGERSVSVFSCREGSRGLVSALRADESSWTRHACGVLVEEDDIDRVGLDIPGQTWPPEGSVSVELGDLYERLADLGLDYGPAFQGLRSVWRRGGEVFCEVSLPEDQVVRAQSFCLHPALFDAALHAVVLADGVNRKESEKVDVRLPFSWGDVRLGMAGTSYLRVCFSIEDETDTLDADEGRGISLVAVDDDGALVVSAGSLLTRPVSPEQLQSAPGSHRESLFSVGWTPLSTSPVGKDELDTDEWVALGGHDSRLAQALLDAGVPVGVHEDLGAVRDAASADSGLLPGVVLLHTHDLVELYSGNGSGHAMEALAVDGELLGGVSGLVGAGLPGRAQAVACGVLSVLQDWVSDERFAESRLVVLTEGAAQVGPDDRMLGLADSGVWGLLRSAQSEHPERLVIVDIDGQQSSLCTLRAALASREPQLALRDGAVFVPRLTGVTAPAQGGLTGGDDGGDGLGVGLGPDCSVLITGGTGGLGALVARHLVAEHEVGCVVLTSRRGLEAPGAVELQEELVGLGAVVRILACDVSDRDALTGLLEQVPAEFPLRGVVHAAGIIDDGVISSLTDERIESVFAPKARAAWYLHELTRDLDLSMFVLFSSAAGTFGSPGQGNYAAANAFLDGLAVYRRAQSLPGTSVAWGSWEQAGEMTSGLGEGDLARMARSGVVGLSSREGLELFDLACGMDEAWLVAVRFDNASLRAGARAGMLPPLLRGLVRVPARRAVDAGSLARRLASVSEPEREGAVLELVRSEVAIVLGHSSASAIDPDRAFKDLGFDSLAAVELRNRLKTITGLNLQATLIFDYPNPTALTRHLLQKVTKAGVVTSAPMDAELDRLELMLSSTTPDEGDRARITARLRTVLSRLDNVGSSGDHVSVTEKIRSASADEVFEFIDKELESS